MKQSIEQLTRLLISSLTPANITIGKEWQQEALQTAADLQVRFMAEYHATLKKKQRTRYVKSMQIFCVQMVDLLEDYRRQIEAVPYHNIGHQTRISFYFELQKVLLSILDNLEKHFDQEMDRELRLPGYRIRETRAFFLSAMEQIQEKPSLIDQDPELKKILVTLIQEVSSHFPLTFVQLSQWKKLLSTLLAPAATQESDPIRFMIAHQFNYPVFLLYVMKQWREQIKHMESTSRIWIFWTTCLHTVEENCFLPEKPFVKEYPSCSTVLSHAIQAELALLDPPAFSSPTAVSGSPNNKPFQTNLSVAQLAAMIRLLVDTGVLDCPNQTQLLKNISQNFTTRRQQEISPESLRQKYYQRDGATVSIVRSYLRNMLQELYPLAP